MFDTPDLGPLCMAPFVALIIGVLYYVTGSAIGLKRTRLGPFIWLFTMPLIVTFACLASIGLGIGAYDPAPWIKPASGDIVGEWRLSPDPTDKFLESAQPPLPARKLIFFEDSTFRAEEIPDLWSYTDLSALEHVGYLSGSGTWHLGQVQGTERLEWALYTQFQEVNGHGDSRFMRYYFQGHLPPYGLATLDSGHRTFHFERN